MFSNAEQTHQFWTHVPYTFSILEAAPYYRVGVGEGWSQHADFGWLRQQLADSLLL